MVEGISPPPSDATFGLDEVLRALSNDLLAARQKAQSGANAGLVVSSAEVDLSFTIQRAVKGGGGIELRVFGLGGGAGGEKERSTTAAHSIHLRLIPLQGGGPKPPPAPDLKPTGGGGGEVARELASAIAQFSAERMLPDLGATSSRAEIVARTEQIIAWINSFGAKARHQIIAQLREELVAEEVVHEWGHPV